MQDYSYLRQPQNVKLSWESEASMEPSFKMAEGVGRYIGFGGSVQCDPGHVTQLTDQRGKRGSVQVPFGAKTVGQVHF